MATAQESQALVAAEGKKKDVTCSAWIRRKEGKNNSDNKLLVVMGRSATAATPPLLELYTFDPKTSSLSSDPWKFVIGEEGANPTGFAVHPSGDEFVCATTKGCKLYKLVPQEFAYHLIAKDEPRLESVGRQKCLAFSTDGSKLAIGGEDGHLRVFHWPSLDTLIDESKAHKSFKDMDIRGGSMATAQESQALVAAEGKKKDVTCSAWIRRKEGKNNSDNKLLVVMGRSATAATPPLLELYTFDPKTSSLSSDPWKFVIGEEGANPTGFAVHPSGDEFVCATTKGCKLYKLVPQEFAYHLIAKDEPRLESVGRQKCLAFSTDGSKLAIGGEDGHLRVFHWPSLDTLIDESKAHKSFKDMDISLDSELLVSTSIDGSARLWKLTDGTPLMNLDRSAEEKIQCCRFSRDGMKPFLFCTVEKRGGNVVTVVWDMATWKRLGFKRLLRKPISVLSVSLDGKYLALGSNDGDFCVVNVKKMEVGHWSRKVHLGASISAIHFCPTERVVISNSDKWGAEVTKLTVPGDWKVWQATLMLLGLFFVSALLMYFFYRTSDSFWNFPMGKNQLPAWKLQEQHIQDSGSMFVDDSEFPDEL